MKTIVEKNSKNILDWFFVSTVLFSIFFVTFFVTSCLMLNNEVSYSFFMSITLSVIISIGFLIIFGSKSIIVIEQDVVISATILFWGTKDNDGHKIPAIYTTGLNVVNPFHSLVDKTSIKTRLVSEVVSVECGDGSIVNVPFTITYRGDIKNIYPWFRLSESDKKRKVLISVIIKESVSGQMNTSGESATHEVLMSKDGKIKFIDHIQQAFDNKNTVGEGRKLEEELGFELGRISIGDLQRSEDLERAMKQKVIMDRITKDAKVLFDTGLIDGKPTLTLKECLSSVMVSAGIIKDEKTTKEIIWNVPENSGLQVGLASLLETFGKGK